MSFSFIEGLRLPQLLLLVLAISRVSFGSNLESLQISCDLHNAYGTSHQAGIPIYRFSWITTSNQRGTFQKAYKIEVATSEEKLKYGKADLWNSGKVKSGETLYIPYEGKAITGKRINFYQVTVWDNFGHHVESPIREFDAGLPESFSWKAKWIGAGAVPDILPLKGFYSGEKDTNGVSGEAVHDGRSLLLRRGFRVTGKVLYATAYVCGLGLYEFFLNGKKVGDHQLSPARSPYHKEILFDSYEVTNLVRQGKNAMGLHLGNGWYNPYKEWWQELRLPWFGSKKAIVQLVIEYEDGKREIIISDQNWKTAPGPSLFNCICDGEKYDATKEIRDWKDGEYVDNQWQQAVELDAPMGQLTPTDMPPVRIVQQILPRQTGQPGEKVHIYDFNQNFSGWIRLTLRGEKGTKVKIRFAREIEALGNLDVSLNQNGNAVAEYILSGNGNEVYEPHFTLFGFRYAEVTAEPVFPVIIKVEGCVVHSDNPPSGSFSCDNELLNQIHRATIWSQKSSMIGFPLDGPPWDDPSAWMGDCRVTSEEALFNFDMSRFYKNWLHGIQMNQDEETGDISIFSPRPYVSPGSIVWSSGYLRLLWDCYRFYADKQLLLDHYDSMVHFFHHLESRSKGDIIPTESADAKGGAGKYMNAQEPESVLTAFYYLDAMLMAKMAGVTGHKNDSVQFSTKAERIRTAYNTRFFHSEKNLYGIGSQTENALPLYLGMVPENKAELVLNSLEKQIAVSDSFRLTAGIHGTKLLLAALSQFGKEETAFQLVNKNGGLKLTDGIKGSNTTNKIPTNNGPNNQSLVGSFDSWFYKSLAGIEPSDQYPAFGKTTIRPFFAKGLNRVDCSLQTIRGKLSSGWIRHGNVVILKIEIPFNCKSEIWIPVDQNTRISESGKPIETASDISLVKKLKDYRVYEIGSGEYVFEIKYPVDRF